MEEKRIILTKLNELETEYREEQKRLDNVLGESLHEKNYFDKGLEELGSDISYLFRIHGYDMDMRQAYHMLEEAQEDADALLKIDRQKIEDEQEDLTTHYRRNVLFYEEDLDLLKRKESTI